MIAPVARSHDIMLDAGYQIARNPFTDERYEHYFVHPDLAVERPDLVLAAP